MITLYTKEDCPNCNIAKLKLYRSQLTHDIVSITPELLQTLNAKYNVNVRSMPIIEVHDDNVYTFDNIDSVIVSCLSV